MKSDLKTAHVKLVGDLLTYVCYQSHEGTWSCPTTTLAQEIEEWDTNCAEKSQDNKCNKKRAALAKKCKSSGGTFVHDETNSSWHICKFPHQAHSFAQGIGSKLSSKFSNIAQDEATSDDEPKAEDDDATSDDEPKVELDAALQNAGWTTVETEDGKVYYWNTQTGETQWEMPHRVK